MSLWALRRSLPFRSDGVQTTAAPARVLTRRRRIARRVGTVLVAVGFLALAYGATIYFWHDPVTDLWARWKQSQLSAELDDTFREFSASAPAVSAAVPAASAAAPAATAGAQPAAAGAGEAGAPDIAAQRRAVAADASRFLAGLELGDPIGRISIPRLEINPVIVNGTRWGPDLSRGPGRYPETTMPGLGGVTAIAGHRTTFGAWFRKIDTLRPGDPITLTLPYGTFSYRVIKSEIVENDDWSIIQPRGFDELVLSACHPLYSASHRWIVYAKLVGVKPQAGGSYAEPAPTSRELAAVTAKTAGHE